MATATRPRMTQQLFDNIVDEVHADLLKAPEEERDMFLLAELASHKLIDYNTTLGRHIRNKYQLWDYEWTPEYADHGILVDVSPFHPDNLSMEIIKAVWLKGNGQTVQHH